jgi:hypothetical protein
VIERHELRPAGTSVENPEAALEVGAIGGGGEILLIPIEAPQPAPDQRQ